MNFNLLRFFVFLYEMAFIVLRCVPMFFFSFMSQKKGFLRINILSLILLNEKKKLSVEL